jgi:hypothetical protein
MKGSQLPQVKSELSAWLTAARNGEEAKLARLIHEAAGLKRMGLDLMLAA